MSTASWQFTPSTTEDEQFDACDISTQSNGSETDFVAALMSTTDVFSETFSETMPKAKPVTFPWPGRTFIVRDTKSRRVIGLRDGKVLVLKEEELVCESSRHDKSCHWRCVQNPNTGWLGFRNAISGTYLGCKDTGSLNSDLTEITAEEHFHNHHTLLCTQMHPEGGHVLLVFGDEPPALHQMEVGELDRVLVAGSNARSEQTLWEFEQV
jgi:hypothetical protein